jgi:hypothetical protein
VADHLMPAVEDQDVLLGHQHLDSVADQAVREAPGFPGHIESRASVVHVRLPAVAPETNSRQTPMFLLPHTGPTRGSFALIRRQTRHPAGCSWAAPPTRNAASEDVLLLTAQNWDGLEGHEPGR